MLRMSLLCLLLVPAFCRADTIPKSDRVKVKLEGTAWEGTDTLDNVCTFLFLKNGEIEYSMGNSKSRIGSWKLEGNRLMLETNNHYADYEGTAGKTEMKLEARNITGLKWTITIKPMKQDTSAKK